MALPAVISPLFWNTVIILMISLIWNIETWFGIARTLVAFLALQLIYWTSWCISYMKCLPNRVSVRGKKVVITGGSSGIGFELAKEMVNRGASHIVLVARNVTRLTDSVDQLQSMVPSHSPQIVKYLSMDLSVDPAHIKQKVCELCEEIGGIDILINCAGYSIPGEFKNLELSVFSKMMDANYFSAVNATHAVIPHMIKNGSGQLVYLSSVGGQLGVYGFTAYAPSKYAIRGFAEVLYTELRPYGIGVSLVFPPDTETPGLASENLLKPKVTQLISEQAGLWKSDDVAGIILDGVLSRKFMIGCGSDGYFINALTCGAAPPSSTWEFWCQCLLMPLLRVYMLFVQTYFTYLINNEHENLKKSI